MNTQIETFPDLYVARVFSFRPAEFFDAQPDTATPPRVSLDS